jgi:hypothetical protein
MTSCIRPCRPKVIYSGPPRQTPLKFVRFAEGASFYWPNIVQDQRICETLHVPAPGNPFRRFRLFIVRQRNAARLQRIRENFLLGRANGEKTKSERTMGFKLVAASNQHDTVIRRNTRANNFDVKSLPLQTRTRILSRCRARETRDHPGSESRANLTERLLSVFQYCCPIRDKLGACNRRLEQRRSYFHIGPPDQGKYTWSPQQVSPCQTLRIEYQTK